MQSIVLVAKAQFAVDEVIKNCETKYKLLLHDSTTPDHKGSEAENLDFTNLLILFLPVGHSEEMSLPISILPVGRTEVMSLAISNCNIRESSS